MVALPAFGQALTPYTPADSPDLDKECSIKYGYIDQKCAFAIGPRFYWAQPFSEGIAWTVKDKQQLNKVYDAIDATGKVLFSVQATHVSPFEKGRAVVDTPAGRTYINRLGQTLNVQDDPLSASDQRTGTAPSVTDLMPEESYLYGSASYNPLLQLVFHRGEEPDGGLGCRLGTSKSSRYSEGLLNVVSSTPLHPATHQCYIDGNRIVRLELPDEVIDAGAFNEGIAPVIVHDKDDQSNGPPKGQLGFIDKAGAFVIKPPMLHLQTGRGFVAGLRFSDGLLRMQLDGRDTFIDRTGHVIGSFPNGAVGAFHDGRAPFAVTVKPDGQILAPDETDYGYQNPPSYRAALCRVMQSCLGDIKFPHPVGFTVMPDNVAERNPMTVEERMHQYRTPPDASGHWPQHRSRSTYRDVVWRIDGFYMKDKGVCDVIRDRVNHADLPKRALTLKHVSARFLLSTSGKVTLEETYSRSLYQ